VARADSPSACYTGPAVLFPYDPKDQTGMKKIREKLDEQGQEFYEAKSDALGFTAFFWIEYADVPEVEELKLIEGVSFTRVSMCYDREGD
jgi:hypothetical protein